jgi:hypothetical protein
MIDYKLFCEVVVSRIKGFLPENLRNGEVVLQKVTKENRRLDGLMIRYPNMSVAPVIYPELFYEDYKRTDDLNRTLQSMADMYAATLQDHPEYDPDEIITQTDHIVYQLVNTEANKQMLSDVPHRQMQDLSVIYTVILNAGDTANMAETVRITNGIARAMNLTEPQLYEFACENTKRIFPPELVSMNQVISEMTGADDLPDMDLYVARNQNPGDGAAVMLDADFMDVACSTVGNECYILPSSRFEVLIIPADTTSLPELAQMVWEVNHTQVSEAERLSNQVYAYDPNKREIVTACEVKEKNITDEAYKDAKFELVEEKEQTMKKEQSQKKEQKGPRL